MKKTYEALRGEIEQLLEEIAPYSERGRVYYAILDATDKMRSGGFLVELGEREYVMKTLERTKKHLLNLRNFCYSTYRLGESDNKTKLKKE